MVVQILTSDRKDEENRIWMGFGVGDEENWNEHGLNEGGMDEGGGDSNEPETGPEGRAGEDEQRRGSVGTNRRKEASTFFTVRNQSLLKTKKKQDTERWTIENIEYSYDGGGRGGAVEQIAGCASSMDNLYVECQSRGRGR